MLIGMPSILSQNLGQNQLIEVLHEYTKEFPDSKA